MNERPIDQWNRLRATHEGDGIAEILSLATTIETGYGPVRYAIGPLGESRLLIPCASATSISSHSVSERVSVNLTRLTSEGRSANYIDIRNLDSRLEPVFAELASEILHRIAGGEPPASSVESTVRDFRSLLSHGDEASDEDVIGLIGELIALRSMLCLSPNATDAWTGPTGQRHDFRRGNCAIEVKTSSRASSERVTISSIDQLDEPLGGSLVLLHIKIERAANGSLSVSSLFTLLISLGASENEIRARLKMIGCTDPHAESWNRLRFELEGLTGYEVTGDFPRIVSSHFKEGRVPCGLHNVVYDIDLGSAREFLLNSSDLESQLRKVAG